MRRAVIRSKADVIDRAYAAYFRWHGRAGHVAVDQPSRALSGVERHGPDDYVILRGRGILAVYRIQPNGFIRGVTRWPRSISGDA